MCRASTCVLLSTYLGCLCILSITAAFVRLGVALGLIRSVAQSYRGFMVRGVEGELTTELKLGDAVTDERVGLFTPDKNAAQRTVRGVPQT